jgi:ribosomal protein L7Ae-like RNA K-turn-binding protein
MNADVLKFIGLLYCGQQLSIASDAIKSIKKGVSSLVIVTEDASNNAIKEAETLSQIHHVILIRMFNKSELGNALGINYVTTISINNKKASEKIVNLIKKEEN